MARKMSAEVALHVKVTRAIERRDWKTVEDVYNQYGVYLQLIAPSAAVKDERTFVYVKRTLLDILKPENAQAIRALGPKRKPPRKRLDAFLSA